MPEHSHYLSGSVSPSVEVLQSVHIASPLTHHPPPTLHGAPKHTINYTRGIQKHTQLYTVDQEHSQLYTDQKTTNSTQWTQTSI